MISICADTATKRFVLANGKLDIEHQKSTITKTDIFDQSSTVL